VSRDLGSALRHAQEVTQTVTEGALNPPLNPSSGRELVAHARELVDALAVLQKALPPCAPDPARRRRRIRRVESAEPVEIVEEERDFDDALPTDEAQRAQEVVGCKTLLLEIVRRAAHDWVLYRSSRRMVHRRLAQSAYTWLFLEDPSHVDWAVRTRDEKLVTSFTAICEALELDIVTMRNNILRLTLKSVMSVGRPAEYRKREAVSPAPAVVMLRDRTVDLAFEAETADVEEELG
jgi:hypothetical protein